MVRSISPDSVPHHKNPIPAAALQGGVLASSSIMGINPSTGGFPATVEEQFALAFAHFEAILAHAGAKPQDVLKMDLHFADKADRPLANQHWLRLYPDPDRRPARHAHQSNLPAGCRLRIEFLAVKSS